MSTLLVLLLIAGTVYALWFHKFTLPDGTEVKGWLAKRRAEEEQEHLYQPEPAQKELEAEVHKQESCHTEIEAENESDVDAAHVGLNIHSTTQDFEEVLQHAEEDVFGDGWDYMQAYFGWLLLGASRNDVLNTENVWLIMSNGYKCFKEAIKVDLSQAVESGEMDASLLETRPTLFANAFLLNGFATFYLKAPECFGKERWNKMEARINAWNNDLQDALPRGADAQLEDEPCAAEFLVRLYTILQDQDDSMLAKNTEFFKNTYGFDFELPVEGAGQASMK